MVKKKRREQLHTRLGGSIIISGNCDGYIKIILCEAGHTWKLKNMYIHLFKHGKRWESIFEL